ncbi:MAG: glycosyltransferase [Planctomycetota bacterium]|nr:glycosyltransferase [Planctomycetota bacterium]
MSLPISAVVPALADLALLEANLPSLLRELDGVGGELVLVDDTGTGILAGWAKETFAGLSADRLRVVSRSDNGGFGRALLDGARIARGELLLAMNPDVRVREGFLAPLIHAIEDPEVFAVSPRVLLNGDEAQPESHNALRLEDGRLRAVPREPGSSTDPGPIPFTIGGAFLVRRAEFLSGGGFDPLFAPFYWEDVDLCLCAWRKGRRVEEVPSSVVEHHHRGTIGSAVPEDLVLAAIEKNRHLLLWKHLDEGEAARDHLTSLWRDALDASMAGRREGLVWLALALQELPYATDSRAALGAQPIGLQAALRMSEPG